MSLEHKETMASTNMRSIFLALLFWVFPTATVYAATIQGKVVSVLDGDTIKVLEAGNQETTVRLHQIDAPEKNQAFGQRSKQALSSLVFGKAVTVKVVTTDKYGRTVGTVFSDGLDTNLEQVRSGMAWVYRKYASDPNYFQAEKSAKDTRMGLWAQPNPTPPWVFRHPERAAEETHSQNSPVPLLSPSNQRDVDCSAKKHCSQMASKEEAQKYLTVCGMKKLDRDGDGVACEGPQ